MCDPVRKTAVADRELFERWRRDGDPAARRALVERHMPLARRLAGRYRGGREPLEDLVQVAAIGLLKAIDRFEPDRATTFSSFATPTIMGELKRHFRDRGWSVRLPRALQELAINIERVGEQLAQASGRTATAVEIAGFMGLTVEQVLEAREAAHAQRAVPLEQPVDDDEGEVLADHVGADDPGYRRAEDVATLERLLEALDDRQRRVLAMRFVGELTQAQIGTRIGVSQMHVSRIISRALRDLLEYAYAPPAPEAASP